MMQERNPKNSDAEARSEDFREDAAEDEEDFLANVRPQEEVPESCDSCQ